MSSDAASIFDLGYESNRGEQISLDRYAGQPLLIVNTATKCGFSPQLRSLEQIHQEYGPRGLVVIGFPCGQFANQEPGNDEQIAEACAINYGVTFPLASKIDVNGEHAHPVFRWLKSHGSSRFGERIKWNFTKFLVSPDGTEIKRVAPQSSPKQLVPQIETWLSESTPASAPASRG